MKFNVLLLIFCVFPGLLNATPDGGVRVFETLFGTGAEGFVILRKENDNPGSYYNWTERSYLDHYLFQEGQAKLVSSKLLLEQAASYPEALTENPLERKTVKKDASVNFAKLLEKYPVSEGSKGAFEAKLELSKKGLTYAKTTVLISPANLPKNGPWVLQQTLICSGCLFVLIENEEGESSSSDYERRVLHIPQKLYREIKEIEKTK